jgi:transcriptional regulator with XRE-family HTH domain
MLKNLIQELRNAGLSQTDIAKRIDYPQSRISDILNDKQATAPYEVGKRLEALRDEIIKH